MGLLQTVEGEIKSLATQAFREFIQTSEGKALIEGVTKGTLVAIAAALKSVSGPASAIVGFVADKGIDALMSLEDSELKKLAVESMPADAPLAPEAPTSSGPAPSVFSTGGGPADRE